jgi:ribosomal protein L11 methyltransferase
LSDAGTTKQQILAMLNNRQFRVTPSALEREICRIVPGATKEKARRAIKELVAEGDLLYTNHYNTTHLEINFRRPVRVSERIILSPYPIADAKRPEHSIVLVMDHGSSFGVGDHPTTRLCLQAIDRIMSQTFKSAHQEGMKVLDIGTGSGVLAMAAVGLGANRAWGIDLDPAALHEAKKNVVQNGLDDRIVLSKEPLVFLKEKEFSLVMVNLRPPTLKELLPLMEALSAPEAWWIISGFRDEELSQVVATIPQGKTRALWNEASCGWAVLVTQLEKIRQKA